MQRHRFSVTVINLDVDAARLEHIRSELGRAGLGFERLSAIDGGKASAEFEDYFPARAQRILSDGEIGCYASHLAVCKRIVLGEVRAPALVLEDDVALSDDFADVVAAALRALPPGWDIVRLSNRPKHACLGLADLGRGRMLVRYSNVPVGAGAILWSRSGAAKFLRTCRRTLPLDHDLRRVWVWDLDTYGVLPPPALRDQCGPSRIDRMAPVGWRADRRRKRLVRGSRTRDALGRHMHGLKEFGLMRWIAAEGFNLIDRLRKGQSVRSAAADPRVLSPLIR